MFPKSENHISWPGESDLLTYDCNHRTCPDIVQVHPCTKFCACTSNGLAMRALTERQPGTYTDMTDSITVTAYTRSNYDSDLFRPIVQDIS